MYVEAHVYGCACFSGPYSFGAEVSFADHAQLLGLAIDRDRDLLSETIDQVGFGICQSSG